MNRRDLLKLFGIGASVVPIVGGSPQLAAESRLIETPKVEPIIEATQIPFMPDELLTAKKGQIQVALKANGHAYWFNADTFFLEAVRGFTDVSSRFGSPEFLPSSYGRMQWTMTGELIGKGKVTL